MAQGKKSFIIYTDSRGMVNKLSDERAGILFKTIFSYCDDENPTCEDEVVDMAFEHFKNILKRDLKKYEGIVDRNRENGKKGGRPQTQNNPVGFLETQEKQNEPKKADTVNVNVTVTENVKEKRVVNKFTAPTEIEVIGYFIENGYPESLAKKAFKYYDTGNWKDSTGKQVRNWKQKMQSVWFKEENKSTPKRKIIPLNF